VATHVDLDLSPSLGFMVFPDAFDAVLVTSEPRSPTTHLPPSLPHPRLCVSLPRAHFLSLLVAFCTSSSERAASASIRMAVDGTPAS
jgi:hypothetical protein